MQKGEAGVWAGQERGVGSTAQQLRLRDSMLADLRSQNKALAGTARHTSVKVMCGFGWHRLLYLIAMVSQQPSRNVAGSPATSALLCLFHAYVIWVCMLKSLDWLLKVSWQECYLAMHVCHSDCTFQQHLKCCSKLIWIWLKAVTLCQLTYSTRSCQQLT